MVGVTVVGGLWSVDGRWAMVLYYAVVKRGHKPGIYMDWQEAELQIKGFSGATFCSFTNKKEAEKYIMRKVDGHDTSSTNELQSRFGKENGTKAEVSTGKLNNPTVLEVKDTLEEYITIDEVSTFHLMN